MATPGKTVTHVRLPSLSWSAGSRVKLTLNISVSSVMMSFTMDTVKESSRTLLLNGPRGKLVRAP